MTFALGFGTAHAFKNFNIRDGVFTQAEAKLHLYKKVQSRNSCNARSVDVMDTRGRTVLIMKNDWQGGYTVAIDWEYSIRGRHEIISYDKAGYERCIVEVGESEQ